MSSMSCLENLNNKELRAKCIEFGLPNVPVTDSSRSVLIRKLLSAMGEGDGRKKTTTRRETTHASPSRNRSTVQSQSPSHNQNNNRSTAQSHSPIRNQNNNRSTAQSHSPSRNQNNNRHTIAASNYKQQEAVKTVNFAAPPSPPAITKVRNSSIRENVHIVPMEVDLRDCSDEEDYTFSNQSTSAAAAAPTINYVYNNAPAYNQHQHTPTLSLSKTNVMSTSYNQEAQPSFHVQDRQYNSYIKPRQMPPAPPAQQRANRSASLSKSGVMTTSYRQETAPLSSHEEYVEDEGVVKSNSYDKVPSTYDRTQYQSLMRQSNTQKLPFESLSNASTSAYNTQNYGGNPLNSTSRYNALETKSQYNSAPARNISPPSRQTILSPSRTTMLPPSRPPMASPTRTTISPPQNLLYPTLPSLHSTTYGLMADDQEEDVEECESEDEISGSDDQLETPFMSKFTRKLDTTQPEAYGRNFSKPVSPALRASYSSADTGGYTRKSYETTDSFRRSGASSGYNSGSQHYYDRGNIRTPLQARRSIGHDDDDAVAVSFQQFLATLNNKYHLKQFFIAFMIFVLSVFVYVVFLQK